MQEVAAEAASLAGHLVFDNLTLIYDSNDVTLDAMADLLRESVFDRFAAYGFNCIPMRTAMTCGDCGCPFPSPCPNGKTHLPEVKTTIAKGIPEAAEPSGGSGEGGKICGIARQGLGLPEETLFQMSSVLERARPSKESRRNGMRIFTLAGCQPRQSRSPGIRSES